VTSSYIKPPVKTIPVNLPAVVRYPRPTYIDSALPSTLIGYLFLTVLYSYVCIVPTGVVLLPTVIMVLYGDIVYCLSIRSVIISLLNVSYTHLEL